MSTEKGGIVCLVSLSEYARFIMTSDGRLRDEIFEENVRGYEGATAINRAIGDSLRQGDAASADFWWLNNGVTVLGRKVQASSKRLVIEDPQIVNGLQTSRNVYQYFSELAAHPTNGRDDEEDARNALVRVIETQDENLATQIIKATNSQNRVSVASLRSTEPFQRDIEEFFAKHDLFYERKKNQYKNQGKPRAHIVEVVELAQAVAAIVLCEPNQARGRPSALVREGIYTKVFSSKAPLAGFYNCIEIMRRVDGFLETVQDLNRLERSNLRFHLARAACAFALQSSRPKWLAVSKVSPDRFDAKRLAPVLQWVLEARDAAAKTAGVTDTSVLAKGAEWAKEIDRRLSRYTDKSRWPKYMTEAWQQQ